MDSTTRLLEHFALEVLERPDVDAFLRSRPDPEGRREALAALLTSRPPGHIPSDVMSELEALLATEREQRGTVEATTIATLADSGFAPAGFPSDRVAFWRGDLTVLRADAIVNAANAQMLGCFVPGHACIDNAIHAIAGPGLRAECAEHMRTQGVPEATGKATVTRAYELPSAYVIHTVGPIVRGPLTSADREALASSYHAILSAAEEQDDITSVGLCSVSTGVFGFPKPAAAEVCLDVLAAWFDERPESRLRIIVALFADVDEAAYRDALARATP